VDNVSTVLKPLNYYKWFRNPDIFMKNISGYEPSFNQKEFLMTSADESITQRMICSGKTLGKTLVLAVDALYHAVILPRFINIPGHVIVGAGSEKQAKRLYGYVRDWIYSSRWLMDLVIGEPLISNTKFNKINKRYKGNPTIEIVTASEKSFRGPHGDYLIIDEAAEAPDKMIDVADTLVSSSEFGRVTISSTPHKYHSRFVEYWEKAKEYGYTTFGPWSCYYTPWINKDMIENARKKFRDQCRILEQPKYNDFKEYPVFIGVDWGWLNPTVIIVVQRIPSPDGFIYLVLSYRSYSKQNIKMIRKDIHKLFKFYRASMIRADDSHKFQIQELRDMGLPVTPIVFKREKIPLLEDLRLKVDSGRVKIWQEFPDILSQLLKYTQNTKTKDDAVMALAMACYDTREYIGDQSLVRKVEIKGKKRKWQFEDIFGKVKYGTHKPLIHPSLIKKKRES
jgi:hypothetical protein